MLTTFQRTEWKEPTDIDQQITEVMRAGTPEEEVRKLFPYKGIALKRLLPYGIPEGTVLQFMRVKHEPSLYPIIGLIGVAGETQWGNYGRRMILDSSEVQLVEA